MSLSRLTRVPLAWSHHHRLALLQIGQAGIATGLAWWVALQVVGDPSSVVFAGAVALGILASSLSQRLRRTIELTLGVAVGLVIGTVLISFIGSGAWQVGTVVVLAMLVALPFSRGTVMVTQAGTTGILIAALSPSIHLAYARGIDALIGGTVAILINMMLLPFSPFGAARRAAVQVLNEMEAALEEMTVGLWDRTSANLETARGHSYVATERIKGYAEILNVAQEAALIAPWRGAQQPLDPYLRALDPMRRAVEAIRGAIRQADEALKAGEPTPSGMGIMLAALVGAIHTLRADLVRGKHTPTSREQLQTAMSQIPVVDPSHHFTRLSVAGIRVATGALLDLTPAGQPTRTRAAEQRDTSDGRAPER